MSTPADNQSTKAAVHTFDPDASPEEKQRQVAANAAKLNLPQSFAQAISAIPGAEQLGEKKTDDTNPGAFEGIGKEIPDWVYIGWKNLEAKYEVGETDPLAEFLSDSLYGQAYHHAAVIFVSVFVTWFMTKFLGAGIGTCIILLAFCATYYKTSIRRFRRNARDDITRELMKERLDTGVETVDWLNVFLQRFWLIYEPVLSASIVQSVDMVLSASTPSFLDSIRLTTFTLGTKPPRIVDIRSYPKTDDDIVLMDWKIAFVPNEISDMTAKQIKNKVNPKIVLTVRVGKGMVGAGMPILLEDVAFSGLIHVKLKLMNNFPHVQTVSISFLEKPIIDYVLKPLGGETFGFDIANIPGLAPFIRDQIHATLQPMMYDPNEYILDMEAMLSGVPLDTAIGVLQLTIFNAKGLKNPELIGSTDPFIRVSVGGRAELARTEVASNTDSPHWNETLYVLLNSLNDVLTLEALDFNGKFKKDGNLGTAHFNLKTLGELPVQDGSLQKSNVALRSAESSCLMLSGIQSPFLIRSRMVLRNPSPTSPAESYASIFIKQRIWTYASL